MSWVGEVLEVFEGKGERLLWLPAVTLGYIYFLSGNIADFGFAVLAVTGGKYLMDFIDEVDQLPEEEQTGLHIYPELLDQGGSKIRIALLHIVTVGFALTSIYSVWRLNEQFVHDDLVLVSLAITYCGFLAILLMKTLIIQPSAEEV